MQLATETLNKLSELALLAAKKSGEYIQGFDRSLLETHFKAAGSSQSSQVVTEVDFACQEIILDILDESLEQYDLAVLSEENCSEENAHLHSRLHKDYFWCIDPLDGTLPFIEGSTGYAVSIALVNKLGQPILAAIHHPTSNTSFHTVIDNVGITRAYKNGLHLQPKNYETHALNAGKQTFTFYTDRSFKSHAQYQPLVNELAKLADELGYQGFEIQACHGAVINALSVIETDNKNAACYIKFPKSQSGGGSLWDFAATACLAKATNSWCSDINGELLDLNRSDSTYMNHKGVLYVSDQLVAKRIIQIYREFVGNF
ncbi:inositol-1-monophosphatase [Psychromonas sp. 14N.309.X.WAT.B.A12]|uniref:3'(2'),5'-bisphosphate nucleotidase CysQ family protein n=1 Tax=Psychromonas sp. 14N.309.X.WAT.B.A12 TaxID=2998322 RepID=UPI0025AFBF46|nr:inositol monophosphatase family protein [Psychromonas sp. 14N.309.X.WAT.B.A12]MDN2661861.1 inositol-1-monophosphatase [Psychromonas sp. 14N.309.X.WAT.B.A12]